MIKIENLNSDEIPTKNGFFVFYQKGKVLYFSKTTNLKKSINFFLFEEQDSDDFDELKFLTDSIYFKTTELSLDALLQEKSFALDNVKPFNFNFWKNNSYLAINPKNKSLKLTEDTQKKSFYLGPFENRFSLLDFLDIIKNTPKNKIIFWEQSLRPHKVISLLRSMQHVAFDKLEFQKENNIKWQIKIAENYQNFLFFLIVTKNINIEIKAKSVVIQNGLIAQIKDDFFPILNIDYRDNELLAFEKNQLAERQIIFQYLQNIYPEILQNIYEDEKRKIYEYFNS
ncbi:MAG: hypothetical protein HN334_00900 [Candidatus Cloacimonetes bacterium]|mgnify:CR=1 FL=1|jgi:hypothetical protein|nr:hypothetical protein [Candidatus Cloacimonadota bacterium]